MSIKYNIENKENYLLVEASGFDESLEEVMQYGAAIIQKAVKLNTTRVLCDERELEYRLNTIDTFKSAEFIAEQAPSIARLGLVCNPKNFEDADFWENVAVNRGLKIKFFTDLEEAKHWVMEDSKNK